MSTQKGVGDLALEILGEVAESSPVSITADPSVPDVSIKAIHRMGIDADKLINEMVNEVTSVGCVGVNLAGGKKEKANSSPQSKASDYTHPNNKPTKKEKNPSFQSKVTEYTHPNNRKSKLKEGLQVKKSSKKVRLRK